MDTRLPNNWLLMNDREIYLQQLTDLARLPDDAPEEMRELMDGALALEQFCVLMADDPAPSIERFRKMANEIKAGILGKKS